MADYINDVLIRLTAEQVDTVNNMLQTFAINNGKVKSSAAVEGFILNNNENYWNYVSPSDAEVKEPMPFVEVGNQNLDKYPKRHVKYGAQVPPDENYVYKIKHWGETGDTRYENKGLGILTDDQVDKILEVIKLSSGSYQENDWVYSLTGTDEKHNATEAARGGVTLDVRDRRLDDPNQTLELAGNVTVGISDDPEMRSKFTVMGETEGQDGTVFGRLVDFYGEGGGNKEKIQLEHWGHQVPNENWPKVYVNRGEDRFNGEDWIDGYSLTGPQIGRKIEVQLLPGWSYNSSRKVYIHNEKEYSEAIFDYEHKQVFVQELEEGVEEPTTIQIGNLIIDGANYGLGLGTVETTREIVAHTTVSADHGVVVEDGIGDGTDRGITKWVVRNGNNQIADTTFFADGDPSHETEKFAMWAKHDGAKIQGHTFIKDEIDKNIYKVKQVKILDDEDAEYTIVGYMSELDDDPGEEGLNCYVVHDGEYGEEGTYYISRRIIDPDSSEQSAYEWVVNDACSIKTKICYPSADNHNQYKDYNTEDAFVEEDNIIHDCWFCDKDETHTDLVTDEQYGHWCTNKDGKEVFIIDMWPGFLYHKTNKSISLIGSDNKDIYVYTTLENGIRVEWVLLEQDDKTFKRKRIKNISQHEDNDYYVDPMIKDEETDDDEEDDVFYISEKQELTKHYIPGFSDVKRNTTGTFLTNGQDGDAERVTGYVTEVSERIVPELYKIYQIGDRAYDSPPFTNNQTVSKENDIPYRLLPAGESVAAEDYMYWDGIHFHKITEEYPSYNIKAGYGSLTVGIRELASGELIKDRDTIGKHSLEVGTLIKATGNNSVATGVLTEATGENSHAEGEYSKASGIDSHAEGDHSQATGKAAHAEGRSIAHGLHSHAEGTSVARGEDSHAEGNSSTATGDYSHVEGSHTQAYEKGSHAEGYLSAAHGVYSHAEGYVSDAFGTVSHAEGYQSKAVGNYSHAEGYQSYAKGKGAHAEGFSDGFAQAGTYGALGEYSHTEGNLTKANAKAAHAEGDTTVANAQAAHAEGKDTIANGTASHAEGSNTTANGDYSHAEGKDNIINEKVGDEDLEASHVEGKGNISDRSYQHLQGTYSKTTHNGHEVRFAVGNGTDNDASNRKNAFAVMENGDAYVQNHFEVDGTSDLSKKVTIGDSVDNHQTALKVLKHSQFDQNVTIERDPSDTVTPNVDLNSISFGENSFNEKGRALFGDTVTIGKVGTTFENNLTNGSYDRHSKFTGLKVYGEIENPRIPQELYTSMPINGDIVLNEFADKFFVNSSIATTTATFRGSFSAINYNPHKCESVGIIEVTSFPTRNIDKTQIYKKDNEYYQYIASTWIKVAVKECNKNLPTKYTNQIIYATYLRVATHADLPEPTIGLAIHYVVDEDKFYETKLNETTEEIEWIVCTSLNEDNVKFVIFHLANDWMPKTDIHPYTINQNITAGYYRFYYDKEEGDPEIPNVDTKDEKSKTDWLKGYVTDMYIGTMSSDHKINTYTELINLSSHDSNPYYVISEDEFYVYDETAPKKWKPCYPAADKNDYCYFQIWDMKTAEPYVLFAEKIFNDDPNNPVDSPVGTDSEPDVLDREADMEIVCERYKFIVANHATEEQEIESYWKFEYQLNNSGFTQAQWAAINSGISGAWMSDIERRLEQEIIDRIKVVNNERVLRESADKYIRENWAKIKEVGALNWPIHILKEGNYYVTKACAFTVNGHKTEAGYLALAQNTNNYYYNTNINVPAATNSETIAFRSWVSDNFVTIDTPQTISGHKTFTSADGIQLNSTHLKGAKIDNSYNFYLPKADSPGVTAFDNNNKYNELAVKAYVDSVNNTANANTASIAEIRAILETIESDMRNLPNNYVTLNTNQEISGKKNFTNSNGLGINGKYIKYVSTLPTSLSDNTFYLPTSQSKGQLALISDIPDTSNFVTNNALNDYPTRQEMQALVSTVSAYSISNANIRFTHYWEENHLDGGDYHETLTANITKVTIGTQVYGFGALRFKLRENKNIIVDCESRLEIDLNSLGKSGINELVDFRCLGFETDATSYKNGRNYINPNGRLLGWQWNQQVHFGDKDALISFLIIY